MRPIGDDVELEEEVARRANDVIPGDEASVSHFVKSFGSHYIVSYTTGNSLYQVRKNNVCYDAVIFLSRPRFLSVEKP